MGRIVNSNKQSRLIEDERLIISIKEARKQLGKGYRHLSDEEIEAIIILNHEIAKELIIESVPRI